MNADPQRYAVADRAGWELEDANGTPWVVQFAIHGITSDILSPGESVRFRYAPMSDSHGIPHGWVALERAGAPAVAFGLDFVPNFSAVPDLAIEADAASCPEEEDEPCGAMRSIRATANGESAVVPPRETATVGGLVVVNHQYSDNRDCMLDRLPEEFQLGIYAPR